MALAPPVEKNHVYIQIVFSIWHSAFRMFCFANSVTRFGDFLKFFSTNLLTKLAQKDIEFWAILKKIN